MNRKKPLICILLCLVLLSGCGGTEKPEPTPLPTVQLAPAITAPPTPTPTPKPSIGPYYEPTVTKSPGEEDKVEGSCIYFSAFATDALRCEWELIHNDKTLDWEKIDETFEGMVAAGIYDNYLVLGNIPPELDGWSVRCKFIGSGNATVYSGSAMIHVRNRTVKIHGEDRKTIRGTGNLSGYGAVIDYEGKNWWDVEEYSGASFSLRPEDVSVDSDVQNVLFEITEDGSVKLTIDETEYSGFLSSERVGGFTASAGLFDSDSDAELTVYFDYTEESIKWESWDKIFLQFPMKAEAEESEAGATEDKAEEDTADSPEPQEKTVEFILTRD